MKTLPSEPVKETGLPRDLSCVLFTEKDNCSHLFLQFIHITLKQLITIKNASPKYLLVVHCLMFPTSRAFEQLLYLTTISSHCLFYVVFTDSL